MQINEMIRVNPKLRNKKNRDKAYLKDSRKFLNKVLPGYNNTNWHYTFSVNNGIKKIEYIPEDLFFLHIESALNKVELALAIADKSSYDNLFSKEDLPATYYKISNNNYFNANNIYVDKIDAIQHLSALEEPLVLKPAMGSGGGKGVVVAGAKEIASLLQSDKKYLSGSYILQEKVKQHPEMAKFHPSSLNTCRIITARVGKEIVVLSSIMRIGRHNKGTDNGKSGGIACNIDRFGNLSEFSSDNMMNESHDRHPDTGLRFKGCKVPSFDKAVEFCVANHRKFIHFTFISWDIGIRENGRPVFIEFNLKTQEIAWHEHFNGPLFGEYTDYFIEQYHRSKHRKGYLKINC